MRTEPDKIAVKADLDRKLAEQVRAAAMADHRSVAGWVRVQLTKALSTDGRGDE